MAARPEHRERWETRTLRALMVPANLVLGGLMAFLVALPGVTLLPALVALGRAFSDWHDDGDDAVVTSLLRELRATWRRTWRAGILAGIAVWLLVVDALFLLAQLGTASAGFAVVLGGATLPVAAVVGLVLLLVPVAAARQRDGTVRDWLRAAAAFAAGRPVGTLALLLIGAAVLATCVVLPTLAPFVALSVPLYLAVRAWPPSAGPAGAGS
ncbi:hypothetical protein [Isoptericola sp. AK164]|uniref:hypothetical protein n=1 Tax=Isoptericola sp. AK164 TaxID=3024246 RepID=UPI0024183941|nr:hypothetical protein [Isoptericola sp. AK164]